MDRALLGCDFSSAPSRKKPIVMARGRLAGDLLRLDALELVETLDGFEHYLRAPGHWVGGFDLPFGLPRELVETLGWPTQWEACMHHYASLTRPQIRALFSDFCNNRPVGHKFAHRKTDGPAGSSPSMKWVNPPVAYMLHAGVPRMLGAGVHFAGLQAKDTGAHKVALEAYPGMLAREMIGTRSYKSDERSRQTPERLIARKDIVNALELGNTRLNLRLRLSHAQRDALVADAKGDALDAVLCMVQAAWALRMHAQGEPHFGLPVQLDPLEGWIVCAPWA
jgi:hypothetical protein